MEISLIFRIAAVGILVIDPVSGIEAQRERGARISDQHGRTDSGAVLAGALYL